MPSAAPRLALPPVFASPADIPGSPLHEVLKQPLLLGLFLPVQSGGWSPSTLPRGTDWQFDYNARLTLQAEALGFDLVFGLAQWLPKGGHGGQIRYREESLDPFVTTAALGALTSRILLISTIQILYGPWHPLHLAKFGATLDHITGGRWGLNMVTGNLRTQALMFGREQIAHDERYAMAEEFTDFLTALWGEDENLSRAGRYWQTHDAYVSPRPRYGRPILVNATGSPAGMRYAARHSDLVFVTSPAGAEIEAALQALPAHIAALRQAGAAEGRALRTLINPMVICRPTEKEAREYHDAIVAAQDRQAVDAFQASSTARDSQAHRGHQRDQRAVGGNVQVVGSPEQVVDAFLRLKAAGCDGVQLTFYDFAPDLAYFGEAVLPLLKQAGLRIG
ncbi:Coenzyme F420-dependent N5,N10-methylene tetrahydromethanopterin reductase and related flavin-dependent oxidoreductases; sulfonate monooxygenase [plant metagenome]|uniref:Coenzyme F420-dependent N5,N10-methylene tetrahydromethanopterin reductase and related flavin-dependent oxidoreductases sulfonate monooxygenase n=1 Tax=plant metagenome TaxID=1297885 RepID=A0A484TWV7_9ZZZZ